MVRNDNTRIGSRIFLNARMSGSLTELLLLHDHHRPLTAYRVAALRYGGDMLSWLWRRSK
ncbi:hypothetical protein ATCCBAA256_22050 [Mycobacterium montefiorense]|nr:hypothetical protein ATCCBAA256_22050 [Mycobacterium montefiorense]